MNLGDLKGASSVDDAALKQKKLAVLGFGRNNRAMIFWLLRHDLSVNVCDQDMEIRQKIESQASEEEKSLLTKIVDWRLGESYLANLTDFDLIFRTPGLPYLLPEIQAAKSVGVKISSQTELFLQLAPCPIIGVTGTKGKSTTAAMIAHLLDRRQKTEDKKSDNPLSDNLFSGIPSSVFLAGNIGRDPFEFIDQLKAEDIVVLELSSFQLQGISVSPQIAVVTRLGVDHLDHHQSIEEYYRAKAGIIHNQKESDYLIINIDGQGVEKFIEMAKSQIIHISGQNSILNGVYVKIGDSGLWETIINDSALTDDSLLVGGKESEAMVYGQHNLENWAAAVAIGYFIFQMKAGECREALKSFSGLPHRLEFLAKVKGVRFYNDSFSTNPSSTIAALKSFPNCKKILICGGSSKNANFSSLAETIRQEEVKAVVAIGQEGLKIIQAINQSTVGKKPEIISAANLSEAFHQAVATASTQDVILLSPACASFDMFKSATDRGEEFRKLVKNQEINSK